MGRAEATMAAKAVARTRIEREKIRPEAHGKPTCGGYHGGHLAKIPDETAALDFGGDVTVMIAGNGKADGGGPVKGGGQMVPCLAVFVRSADAGEVAGKE